MSKKLLYLMCFVVMLGLTGNATAQIDPATVTNGHVYLLDNVVDNVPDDSANDHVGALLGDPQVVDGLNGKALQLDGVDDAVHLPDTEGINTSTHQNHTVVAIFNCADVGKPGYQCVYEEGGSTRGLTIYVHGGRAWVGAWNRADYDPQWNPGTFFSAPVASGNWHAVAAVLKDGTDGQEDGKFEMWMDGELIGVGPGAALWSRSDDNAIGTVLGQTIFHDTIANAGHWFEGTVDELWILNDPVSEADLETFVGSVWPFAYGPSPASGTQFNATSGELSWVAGGYAVSHDVYLGTNIDDVIAGTGDTFIGNQVETTLSVADLSPDMTYYWRIDAINDDNPDSPWIGDIWSFTIPPAIAYNPSPADGAKFTGPAVVLSWTAGVNATEHTVYIGDDFAAVSDATGGTPQAETTYDAGVLEKGTMYYWRVDESDGAATLKGDVWSFETPPVIEIVDPNLVAWYKMDNEGFGLAVVDSSGYDHHGTLRGDPQWVAGLAGGAIELDGSGDYVNIDGFTGINADRTDPDNPFQKAFTVTCWINTTSGEGSLVCWGSSNGAGVGGQYQNFRINGGSLRAEHGNGNYRGNTRVHDGEWHHVVMAVAEGANLQPPNTQLYVDGQPDTRRASGNDQNIWNLTEDADVGIGVRASHGDRLFTGLFDEVRIYDKQLSEDEVKLDMRIDAALAWDPQPANGGDTAIWTALSWQAGDGAVEHDVYFGTDADAVSAADASDTTGIYVGRQAETMIVPAGLEWTTTYYWRVDEIDADGAITTGLLWKFTTSDEIVLYDEVTPFPYDNSADPFLSEIALDLDPAQDWTGGCGSGIGAVSVSYDGLPGPGSLTEADGVYTIVGRGMGAWNQSDEIQYAHTTLTGDGSMIVKVESLDALDDSTRVGIMIRESLDPGSAHASVYVSSANGVLFQARTVTGQDTTQDSSPMAASMAAPIWLKIERSFPMINASFSLDGEAWLPATMTPQVIPMTPLPIHIGLVVSANSADSATAVVSNVSSTGGVAAGPLTFTEIGLESNSAESMYLVLEDTSGATAAAMNPDPAATQLVGAEWIIDLDEYSIDRAAVVKATLVIGDLANPAAGGSGMLTINSVKLLPDCVPVGHWELDEGSGNIAVDSSRGGGNDGIIVDNPVWDTQWISGVVGGAMEFYGVGTALGNGDYIEIANDPSLDLPGPISIALWIRPDANDPEGQGTETAPMAKAMSGISPWNWQVRYGWGSPEPYMAFTFNTQPRAWAYVNQNLTQGEWAHIACSHDGETLKCYLNGVETDSTPMGEIATGEAPVLIGSDGWGCDWIGAIDDVRIYDVGLPESEIIKLATP